MNEEIKTEKLRADMNEMELVLDQWDVLKEELHRIPKLVAEFAEYGTITVKGYTLNNSGFVIHSAKNTISRLTACMKLASYTLAGQLAMLPAEKCKWTSDLDTDNACFSTDCGDGFWFQSGFDDSYKFCIFCGKEIDLCLEEPEDDEPEAA